MTDFDRVKQKIAQINKYDKQDTIIKINREKYEIYVEGDKIHCEHKLGKPSTYFEVTLDEDNSVTSEDAKDAANILFDWAE